MTRISRLRIDIPGYPPGAPCWLDLLAADIDAVHAFYAEIFGWTLREPDDESGGYTIALLDDAPVAGYSAKPEGLGLDSQWTTYLATPDLRGTSEAFTELGGTLVANDVTMGLLGRVSLGVDPAGASVGLWKPIRVPGHGTLEEHGALGWNELMTRDYDGSRIFYSRVFEHLFREEGGRPGDEEGAWATAYTLDANPAYGLGHLDHEVPESIPSHWMPYFAVDDIIETLSLAAARGGTVLREAGDTAYGRTAVLAGLEGERFGIITPHE